jgi:putative transposase
MTRGLPAQARPFTAGIAAPLIGGRGCRLTQSGRRCCSTYRRMIASGAPPQEAAKYDGDHRWLRWVRNRTYCRNRQEDTPLRSFAIFESCTVCGNPTSTCTWSSSPFNSTSAASKSMHTSASTGSIAAQGLGGERVAKHVIAKTRCGWTTNARSTTSRVGVVGAGPYGVNVSIVRYRYRVYPTPGQAQALARTFGCARVVYNDALRARREAQENGEKLSDTEVQRRVVTLAKRTPERAWLGEVASVVLVQACQDARRAYRNWFDSLSGRRKGRRVGRPRLRSRKDNRQSIRLTRNGFSVRRNGRLFVAKVGELRVEWSRPLPSSVTVIREADGRFYASFVVERDLAPLPPTDREVGVDLGLDRLAVTSDGEIVDNPRHLRRRARKLARLQRELCRKRRGSANRRKAVRRVAVAHRKVREARLDAHHKLALRLVRDNQAVHLEDLSVAGLARTRLARSIHDAGWSTLVRLVEEKAAHYGRTVVKISRWFPSSRLCSTCGRLDGPKPLKVRSWTCPTCGTEHDRDLNAARNVLAEGRRVAAGLADTENACGADVRPGAVPAVGDEAGTRLGALA